MDQRWLDLQRKYDQQREVLRSIKNAMWTVLDVKTYHNIDLVD